MHHIYHTEAVVLGGKNRGEADKFYYLFTRELGLVYARAQGVRKLSSKLRFILQDMAWVKADLVEGKDVWRVTSASKGEDFNFYSDPIKLRIAASVCRLLQKLLAGAEKNLELFDDVMLGFRVLETAEPAELQDLEAVLVLRILNHLGYIGNPEVKDFVQSPLQDIVWQVPVKKKAILREINRALRETHL